MTSQLPQLNPFDRRLNLFNEDLAEASLQGKVDAKRFVEGEPAQINVAFTELRSAPDFSAPIDTQLMYGETLRVFERKDAFAWVKADRDGYVGWLETKTLVTQINPATHLVCAPRTFFYPEPDMKLPHKGMRSMGSAISVIGHAETRGTKYALLAGGEAIIEIHIRPIDQPSGDYVSVAEQLIHTPYLWAGTTAFGLDCSGLVKLCLFMCNQFVLRDSDMQAATLGEEIDAGHHYQNLTRGDLIFWRGHVAIVNNPNSIIHANGHTMNVAIEPLDQALERIEYLYEKPIGYRRPK